MKKETAIKYKAIAEINNLALSNNLDAYNLLLNIGVSKTTYYCAIKHDPKYYQSIINQIEADQIKVAKLLHKGYSKTAVSRRLSVTYTFVEKSRQDIHLYKLEME